MHWIVEKVSSAKTSWWVVLILIGLLVLGLGISGTLHVLRKRKYAKIMHQRNKLLEEKEAAKAMAELSKNENERKDLERQQEELGKKVEKLEKTAEGLDRKHERVKKALENVTSWDDLKVD